MHCSSETLTLSINHPLNFYRRHLLTLSQTTSFRLFTTKRATTSNLIKMAETSPKRVENTVGKGEIASYEQFLLFPWCFQKTCTADT